MSLPFELFVGLRYTKAKRKNHFISFISLTSMIGIGLGVAALIVVLSVMNGFQTELRSSILGVASHIEVSTYNNALVNWQDVAQTVQKQPNVMASAPYINAQGMLSYRQYVQGVIVRGVLPSEESKVSDIASNMQVGDLPALKAGEFNMVLGVKLARMLGVQVGEKVTLMAPQGQYTPAGVVPRIKQFNLVGLFSTGNDSFDTALAIIHIDDAAKLYRMENQVSGLRLKLNDLFKAPTVAKQLTTSLNAQGENNGSQYYVSDWTEQTNLFKAIEMEKRVMFIILTLIVAVAAFNIVSTLVMAVTDKRADIAILRTFGASPNSIMKIFIIQGALIGVIGTVVGALAGVLIAINVGVIVPFIEGLFGIKFLASDIYQISEVPSQLLWSDVGIIVVISFLLTLLATLYPSYKAARTNPAEALRYE